MYLWIKALHIVFIASWFAGLFYLPRIFVNLAQESNPAVVERLLGMGRSVLAGASTAMADWPRNFTAASSPICLPMVAPTSVDVRK